MLSTPWRLCLTATVYHRDGDPGELLTLPDADALDQHLLARYISAATRTVPNPRGYTPQDVHYWLHYLTVHLDPTGTLHVAVPARAKATDLVLHELWPLAGRTRVRTTDALLTTLTVLTPLPLLWTTPQPPAGAFAAAFAAALGCFALMAGVLATTTSSPKSPGNPFRTPQGRRDFAIGLSVALLTGPTTELTTGLMGGLLTFGLLTGLGQRPGTSLGARALLRRDALVGFAIGLGSGPGPGLMLERGRGLWFVNGRGLAFVLVIVLVFALLFGLGLGAQASRRYVVFLLCSRRRLPFRLGLFLDWAVTAGLLRYSGPAYQYRHRELQHWLRRHPQPPALS
ncbi:hypothetical protein ABZ835_47225 [Streptomyces sp. NPDC047461]|uniref:hypothetical protein n=1 Tax=Streptomyces sp. NPDC047461 TaxID=3155619 RepID=UPI0033F0427E